MHTDKNETNSIICMHLMNCALDWERAMWDSVSLLPYFIYLYQNASVSVHVIVQISPWVQQAVVCTNSIGIQSLMVTAFCQANHKISALGYSAGREKAVWNGTLAWHHFTILISQSVHCCTKVYYLWYYGLLG